MTHWPETAIDEYLDEMTAVPIHDLPERVAGPPAPVDDLTATLQRMRILAAHNYPTQKDVKNEQR